MSNAMNGNNTHTRPRNRVALWPVVRRFFCHHRRCLPAYGITLEPRRGLAKWQQATYGGNYLVSTHWTLEIHTGSHAWGVGVTI
jgi:hypothetical protein